MDEDIIEEMPYSAELISFDDICKICPVEGDLLAKLMTNEETDITEIGMHYIGEDWPFTEQLVNALTNLMSKFQRTTKLKINMHCRTTDEGSEIIFPVDDIYEKTREATKLEVLLGHDIPTEMWIEDM